MAIAAKIFISYRREDAADAAGRIRDWLVQTGRFARDDVFMDVTGIMPGTDFMRVIDEKIAQCTAMIVVISPQWIRAITTDAAPYLVAEVEAALRQAGQRKFLIIPVLVGGAQMPEAQELPESVRPLTRLSATQVRAASFDYDMGLLRGALGIKRSRRGWWLAAASIIVLVACGLCVLSQALPNLLSGIAHSATPTVTPMATATQGSIPTIFVQDPLTSDAKHWNIDNVHCFFGSDGFHLKDGYACFNTAFGTFGNAAISVQVARLSSTEGGLYGAGIAFRTDEFAKNYYGFSVSDKGHWFLTRVVNGQSTQLLVDHVSSAIVTQVGATNVLRVVATGAQFTFYVNNVNVGSYSDTALAEGYVGLFGAPNSEEVFVNLDISASS